MSFPNFSDELSEFCSTFLIFQPKISEDLFFFSFFLGLTPSNFPNLAQLSEFPDELSEFCSTFLIFSEFSGWAFRIFDYFPNSRLLSEFWFTFRILTENGPGTGFLGSHFFPILFPMCDFCAQPDKEMLSNADQNHVFSDEERKIQHQWDDSCHWQKWQEDEQRHSPEGSFSTDNGKPWFFFHD